MSAGQVFISYARENLDEARRLSATLDARGFSVWMDLNSIRFGVWPEIIEAAVGSSQAMVVLFSRHAAASEWVLKEVELASQFGKGIIPLELEPVKLPDAISRLIWRIHRIPIHALPPGEWLATLVDALCVAGATPQAMDLQDPRFLLATEMYDGGDFAGALPRLEELVKQRPWHLAAVSMLVGCYYNAARVRILKDEQRGLRPLGQQEMAPEFYKAEEAASAFLGGEGPTEPASFLGDLWFTLGMISAFAGTFDDAFKRLSTALVCDPTNEKVEKALSRLREEVGVVHTRNQRGDFIPHYEAPRMQYPEPHAHSTWHPITFPFTVRLNGEIPSFPANIPEDWKQLWIIDYNIGRLERSETRLDAAFVLLMCIQKTTKIKEMRLLKPAWSRIAGAMSHFPISTVEMNSLKAEGSAALTALASDAKAEELRCIWNPV